MAGEGPPVTAPTAPRGSLTVGVCVTAGAATRTLTGSAEVPFPAKSVAVTTSHCSPFARSRLAVQVQFSSSAVVAPHSTVRRSGSEPAPARTVTRTFEPGSARPASFGRLTRRVSPGAGVVSTGRSGATVSTTNVTGCPGVRFPAASTATGVSWCFPSVRFSTGRQDDWPSGRTAVLHSSPAADRSATETVLPASPVPVSCSPGSLV